MLKGWCSGGGGYGGGGGYRGGGYGGGGGGGGGGGSSVHIVDYSGPSYSSPSSPSYPSYSRPVYGHSNSSPSGYGYDFKTGGLASTVADGVDKKDGTK